MKNKKLTALLLAATMMTGVLAGCGGGNDDTTADGELKTVTPGKLTVALSPDFAPMEFVDPSKNGQDQYVGFDPTLAKYIAEDMGLELEIAPMSFDACMVAVTMGSVDMAISGFSWTKEREENFNLSNTYHAGDNEDGQTTITMKDNADKFADAASVEGLRVGAQAASLQELLAKEQLANAEVVPYTDIATGVMQMRSGDFDIMAVADGNADALIAANSDVVLAGFDFEVDPKYTDNLVLMQKGNDALTEKVNEILAKAESENKYPGWYEDSKALAGIGTEVSYDENGNVVK